MEVQQRRDKEQLGDTSSLSSSFASTASCFFACELDEPKPSHGDTADSKASQPEQAKAATKDGRTTSARPEWARRPLPVGTADQLFNPERYLLWHKRALLQRMRVGYGRSHEMIRLYNFWVSFLQDAFNEPMYTKFKTYAEEDASAGYTYGLTCLFSFYRRYLTARFEAEIYQDFEALALKYQDYLNYMEGMDCLFAFLTTGSTGCSSSSSMPQTLPVHVQHGWPAAAGGTHPAAAGSNWPADSSHAPMPAAAPGTEGHAVMLGEPQEPASGVAVVQQQPRRHAASMRSSLDETSSASASCSDGAPTSTAAAPSQTSTSPAPCFPGLPRDAGVTVDPRVVEQFQLWHASQACTWALQGGGSSGGQRCIDPDDGSSDIMHTGGSLTGSSEAGDAAGTEGEGRPVGRKAQRQQGARAHRGSWSACGGPPAPFGPYAMGYGASPPGLVSGFACSLPVASTLAAAYPLLPDTSPGRHMSVGSTPSGGFSSGFKVGSAPGVPPLAGATPSGTRAKRPRHKPGNFKRCTSFLPGSSPSVAPVLGSSPPLRSHASAPYGPHASTSTRACGARVGKAAWANNATKGSQARAGGAAPRAVGVPASQGHKHVGAEPGAGQDAGPPLWEAQPCAAACGASAELIRALPMRLGELFGD